MMQRCLQIDGKFSYTTRNIMLFKFLIYPSNKLQNSFALKFQFNIKINIAMTII